MSGFCGGSWSVGCCVGVRGCGRRVCGGGIAGISELTGSVWLFGLVGGGLLGGVWLGRARLRVKCSAEEEGCGADGGAGCVGSEFEFDGHDLQFTRMLLIV